MKATLYKLILDGQLIGIETAGKIAEIVGTTDKYVRKCASEGKLMYGYAVIPSNLKAAGQGNRVPTYIKTRKAGCGIVPEMICEMARRFVPGDWVQVFKKANDEESGYNEICEIVETNDHMPTVRRHGGYLESFSWIQFIMHDGVREAAV